MFRSQQCDAENGEIRTADLFIEPSEAEIDQRARGLGRPLLFALLESARHAHECRRGYSADARRWLRDLLRRHATRIVADIGTDAELSLAHLRSLYDSYRIDQVAHLVALIGPRDFSAVVERFLDGREIDFRAGDRFQLAMTVVQELERLLPLPPLELWVEDYMAHPADYAEYAHALHRDDALP